MGGGARNRLQLPQATKERRELRLKERAREKAATVAFSAWQVWETPACPMKRIICPGKKKSPFMGGHFGPLPPPAGPCLTPRLFVASPDSGLRGKIHKTSRRRRKPRQGLCNVQHNRAGQLPALEGEGPALAGATEPEGISQLRGEDGG